MNNNNRNKLRGVEHKKHNIAESKRLALVDLTSIIIHFCSICCGAGFRSLYKGTGDNTMPKEIQLLTRKSCDSGRKANGFYCLHKNVCIHKFHTILIKNLRSFATHLLGKIFNSHFPG